MGSKKICLTIPEEFKDIYYLLKSKRRPSNYVIHCIKFYEQQMRERETQSSSLSQKEHGQLDSFSYLSEEKLKELLKPMIMEILKSQNLSFIQENVVEQVIKDSGQDFGSSPGSILNNYSAEVSFEGALDMFDDD